MDADVSDDVAESSLTQQKKKPTEVQKKCMVHKGVCSESFVNRMSRGHSFPYPCAYCGLLSRNIQRHLITRHSSEMSVMELVQRRKDLLEAKKQGRKTKVALLANAYANMLYHKFSKRLLIPVAQDVKKLALFLVDLLKTYDYSEAQWREVAITLEAYLLLYNNRTPAEIEELT